MKKMTLVLLCLLAARHLASPAAGEAIDYYNSLTDCSQIAWQSKSHTFYPNGTRDYFFKGTWWSKAYIPGRFNFNVQWVFDIKGKFIPKTGFWEEVVVAQAPEGITATGAYQCSTTPCPELHQYWRSGTASGDPWLEVLQSYTQFPYQTLWCFEINGSREYDYPPCPMFFSTCAFSETERAALAAETVAVGTCTPSQAAAPPQVGVGINVMGPAYNGHFDDPGDANAAFAVGCLPSSIAAENSNRFFVDVEKKEWDNERYGYFWLSVNKDMDVDMMLNEQRGVGAGAASLGLREPGTYRVRAMSFVNVREEQPGASGPVVSTSIASDYSPWTVFTAGSLTVDPTRAGTMKGKVKIIADDLETRKPDLTIAASKVWLEGQGMRSAWLIRNSGTRSAPATDLLICCRHVGQSVCPEGFGEPTPNWDRCGLRQVEDELYPKPEGALGTPGGGTWVSLPFLIPVPPAGARYELLAKVDATETVVELDDGNNVLQSTVPKRLSIVPGAPGTAVLPDQFDPAPPGVASLQGGDPQLKARLPRTAIGTAGASTAPGLPMSATGGVRTPAAPAVAVRRISLNPSPPRAAEPFSVTIEFVNGGTAASATSAEYAVECTVVSGAGACPLGSNTRRLGFSIAPAASLFVGLPATAAPGTYRLEVKPLPVKSGAGKTLEFTIAAPPMLKHPGAKRSEPLPGIRPKLPKR